MLSASSFRLLLATSLVLFGVFFSSNWGFQFALLYPALWAIRAFNLVRFGHAPRFGRVYSAFVFVSAVALAAFNNTFYQQTIARFLDLFFERHWYELDVPGSGFEHYWYKNGDDVLESLFWWLRAAVCGVVVLFVAAVCLIGHLFQLEIEAEMRAKRGQRPQNNDVRVHESPKPDLVRYRLTLDEVQEHSHRHFARMGMPIPAKIIHRKMFS